MDQELDGVSVVIPAYNEEQGIGMVLDALLRVMANLAVKYEVLVVDDASSDNTARIAAGYGVRVISQHANRGYGAALKTGINQAVYDLVIILDADGQHNPADIPTMLELAKQHEVVFTSRQKGSYTPFLRKPGKWILGKVANILSDTQIPDLNCGFRAFRRSLVQRYFSILPDGFSFSTTLTIAAVKDHLDVAWMPITTIKREGKSTVKPLRDGYRTLLLILRLIVLFDPLKVFLPTSFGLGAFGLAFSVYGVIRFGSFPESGVFILLTAILVFFIGILADSISALRRGLTR